MYAWKVYGDTSVTERIIQILCHSIVSFLSIADGIFCFYIYTFKIRFLCF